MVTTNGTSAHGFLQSLADVACSTGVVDRGLWLRIARQYLSCALDRVRGIVLHRLVFHDLFCLQGLLLHYNRQGRKV